MSTIIFAPDSPADLDDNFEVETLPGGGFDITGSPVGNSPFGNQTNYVNGSPFDDIYNGADIPDVVDGGEGADILDGADGDDNLDGGAGDDLIDGGNGKDVLTGGTGFDTLDGGDDDDNLDGGQGNDALEGGDGEDVLQGGEGKDTLSGGDGNDTLIAGAGDDVLTGGDGEDSFVFQVSEETGGDVITDFEAGTDTIRIIGAVGGNVAYDSDSGILSVNGKDLVKLDPGLDLGPDDFELF